MNPQLQQLIHRITANRKRFVVMSVLTGAMMLLWGRLLLKQVPRDATATPPISAAFVPATPADDADASHVEVPTRVSEPVAVADHLTRSIFAIDTGRYPINPDWDDPSKQQAKSAPTTSDEEIARRIRADAHSLLKLQTTVSGDPPRAMINDQVLSQGDIIGGYRLERILTRGVIVAKEGVKARIDM